MNDATMKFFEARFEKQQGFITCLQNDLQKTTNKLNLALCVIVEQIGQLRHMQEVLNGRGIDVGLSPHTLNSLSVLNLREQVTVNAKPSKRHYITKPPKVTTTPAPPISTTTTSASSTCSPEAHVNLPNSTTTSSTTACCNPPQPVQQQAINNTAAVSYVQSPTLTQLHNQAHVQSFSQAQAQYMHAQNYVQAQQNMYTIQPPHAIPVMPFIQQFPQNASLVSINYIFLFIMNKVFILQIFFCFYNTDTNASVVVWTSC